MFVFSAAESIQQTTKGTTSVLMSRFQEETEWKSLKPIKEERRTMQHEFLLQQLVDQLKPVQGLRAIVLGGSYANGSQRPDSDIDIGLYYNEQRPLSTAHVRSI